MLVWTGSCLANLLAREAFRASSEPNLTSSRISGGDFAVIQGDCRKLLCNWGRHNMLFKDTFVSFKQFQVLTVETKSWKAFLEFLKFFQRIKHTLILEVRKYSWHWHNLNKNSENSWCLKLTRRPAWGIQGGENIYLSVGVPPPLVDEILMEGFSAALSLDTLVATVSQNRWERDPVELQSRSWGIVMEGWPPTPV